MEMCCSYGALWVVNGQLKQMLATANLDMEGGGAGGVHVALANAHSRCPNRIILEGGGGRICMGGAHSKPTPRQAAARGLSASPRAPRTRNSADGQSNPVLLINNCHVHCYFKLKAQAPARHQPGLALPQQAHGCMAPWPYIYQT